MRQFYDTFSTPLGDFSVALAPDGSVIATAFGGITELSERFTPDEVVRDAARAADVRREVGEYFSGQRKKFSVRLSASGTTFQHQVWSALQRIPYGETRTYGGVATELGKPEASRAVGRANATNPICLIVPCHRVIGADGTLTGFAFGEDLKRRLLEHEGALAAA
ncbi:MAG: methylated-DNA--[protein]-cysteine S-methyltransferase [Opitutus sp.]